MDNPMCKIIAKTQRIVKKLSGSSPGMEFQLERGWEMVNCLDFAPLSELTNP
jgi:hypothetical protein